MPRPSYSLFSFVIEFISEIAGGFTFVAAFFTLMNFSFLGYLGFIVPIALLISSLAILPSFNQWVESNYHKTIPAQMRGIIFVAGWIVTWYIVFSNVFVH